MSPSTTTTVNTESSSSFFQPPQRQVFAHAPCVLVIGAGSRGTAYAAATLACSNALIVGVCEPDAYKRTEFARKFMPQPDGKQHGDEHGEFQGGKWAHWRDWVSFESEFREREERYHHADKAAGEKKRAGTVDAVFVCVLDEMHEAVVRGIADAGIDVHVCCEKPMSTTLGSCVRMRDALRDAWAGKGALSGGPTRRQTVFEICHVLRYSPHNMLLRHLVREKGVVGEVLSLEHTEPVGWWHFSHSYVRGNWRKESKTAPSLLTKSCHDIDFILWMLCSPSADNGNAPHLPSYITSTGSRKFFRRERKPEAAGDATNCLACPHESECIYSAKKIYLERHLQDGNTGWPVKIVNPEIEECYMAQGLGAASAKLLDNLRENYDENVPEQDVEARPWFGRCVWESDNDVCDDQCVTLTWEDDDGDDDGLSTPADTEKGRGRVSKGRGAKTAQFHMVAFTKDICERRGRIYGTQGEIEYDSRTITVHDFVTGETKSYTPHMAGGGHGGGDEGLARQFLMAVDAVDGGRMGAQEAQREFLGCDLDEAFLSHAAVFAAEEARVERKVVDWGRWWSERVEKGKGNGEV